VLRSITAHDFATKFALNGKRAKLAVRQMEQNYRDRTLKSLLLAWASYRKGNRDEAEQRLSEIVNWWQSEGGNSELNSKQYRSLFALQFGS